MAAPPGRLAIDRAKGGPLAQTGKARKRAVVQTGGVCMIAR